MPACLAAGLGSGLTGKQNVPVLRLLAEAGKQAREGKEGRIEERKNCDKGADFLSNTFNHFSSFLYLLPCPLSTDVEGFRSEERKDLEQSSREYAGVKKTRRKRVMDSVPQCDLFRGGLVCCGVHAVCFIGLWGEKEQNICAGYGEPHGL